MIAADTIRHQIDIIEERVMKKNIRGNFFKWIFPLLLAGIIFGCATAKINPSLQKAQAAYQSAKSNPDIEKNATDALYEAKKSLDKAMTAKNDEEIEREAYRTERLIQIAVAQAEQKIAESKIEQLTKEKEALLLERSRRQEEKRAFEARQLAEEQAKAAEMARLEAEKIKKEAAEKAMAAEKLRQEAELAKANLPKEFAELNAKQTDRGIVLTLGNFLFETGKAELQPGALRAIEKVTNFLIRNPNRSVLIEGHTDSTGSDDDNLALSELRADIVRRALIDDQITTERIFIKGYGKQFPIASNDTPKGRRQNRRVEIIILNEGVSAGSVMR